jgi:hypothetical protein
LDFPRYDGKTDPMLFINKDASGIGNGGVLMQDGRAIAYASR